MKPQVMSVGQAVVDGSTISHIVTRTNGQAEEMRYEWADMVAFLRAYHGAWDNSEAAMWGFIRFDFAPTTIKCYFNWVEGGKPSYVKDFCQWNIGEVIAERNKYMRDQFAKASKAAKADRLHSAPGHTTEFSQATIFELHLNQRFPRA